jgi:hypothetical protein
MRRLILANVPLVVLILAGIVKGAGAQQMDEMGGNGGRHLLNGVTSRRNR